MLVQISRLFVAILLLCFVSLGQGCHFYHAKRKRRQAEDSRDQAVIETEALRDYFTACMTSMLPGQDNDWRSNVDFSVLDTNWYLDNSELICGFGNTEECWKDNLITYLNVSSSILPNVETCIDDYSFDFATDPPTPRYQLQSGRRKRQARFTTVRAYSTCLEERTDESYDLRPPLNYQRLTRFIEKHATTDNCYDVNTANSLPQTWQATFASLTRTDSPLRASLRDCGRQHFPQDFPPLFDGPGPVQWVSWQVWGVWSPCPVTCGSGNRIRERMCLYRGQLSSPIDQSFCICEFGGGGPSSRQDDTCNMGNCPTGYSYGQWGSWTPCTRTCGQGTRTRSRICVQANNIPVNVGFCRNLGPSSETQICRNNNCYRNWSQWTQCSVTCIDFLGNSGSQTRIRCLINDPTCRTARDVQNRSCRNPLPRPCPIPQ